MNNIFSAIPHTRTSDLIFNYITTSPSCSNPNKTSPQANSLLSSQQHDTDFPAPPAHKYMLPRPATTLTPKLCPRYHHKTV